MLVFICVMRYSKGNAFKFWVQAGIKVKECYKEINCVVQWNHCHVTMHIFWFNYGSENFFLFSKAIIQEDPMRNLIKTDKIHEWKIWETRGFVNLEKL